MPGQPLFVPDGALDEPTPADIAPRAVKTSMDKSVPPNEPHTDAQTVKTEPTQPVTEPVTQGTPEQETTAPPSAQVASPDEPPPAEPEIAPEAEPEKVPEVEPEPAATQAFESQGSQPDETEQLEERDVAEAEPAEFAAPEERATTAGPFAFEPTPFTAPPELQRPSLEEARPAAPEPVKAREEAAPAEPAHAEAVEPEPALPDPTRPEPAPAAPSEPELVAPRPVELQPAPITAATTAIPELVIPVDPHPTASEEFVPLFQRLDKRSAKAIAWRTAKLGAIVFCGWFIAILILIGVYRFVNPPFSTLMAMQWVTGTQIKQEWEPISDISPNLVRAVITSEDGRFCRHWGIDFVEVAHAIQNSDGGIPRGASTISMQVAKNLFLWPSKSYVRKAIEVPVTYAIELLWTKRRIMEVYLNIAEWGPGIFGAQAASKAHFGRSAAKLSMTQAARLAVALPNPFIRDAGDPGPWTRRRAKVIQGRATGSPGNAACVLSSR